MGETKQLYQHMQMRGLAHLGLHNSEVASNVSEYARLYFTAHSIREWRTRLSAMKERADRQAHGCVEAASSCGWVLHRNLMKSSRVCAQQSLQILLRGFIAELEGKALDVAPIREVLMISQHERDWAPYIMRVLS